MSVGQDLLDASLEDTVAVEAGSNGQDQDEVSKFAARARKMDVIPLSLIRKSDIALRGVNRQTEGYQLLLDSVKKKGVLNSILVREQIDPGTKVKVYGLIDGLQRFTASMDAGHTTIPANIVEMDDAEVLEAQLITNLNRIQTKPAEVSKHLLRILSRNPLMTKRELAEKCSQSLPWVDQRLSLLNLAPDIQALVNEGKINLTNAYALSKIEKDEQPKHVEAAMTESQRTFVPRMKQLGKELKDARKSGQDAQVKEFTPAAFVQKPGEIKDELNKGCAIGTVLLKRNDIPAEFLPAWELALKWVLHLDKDSQEAQRVEYEAKKKEREEEKARIKAQREKEKQEKAIRDKEDITKGW